MEFTQQQQKELEIISKLYRDTIYNEALISLPDMVKSFYNELKHLDGEIATNISSEVSKFYNLITSDYLSIMRNRIDGLHKALYSSLPKDILFTISCRQKSWDSVLKKILKYYFEGRSLNLYDLVALRITIDSTYDESEQEKFCHHITEICISFFNKEMCVLMPPAKLVAGNPLLKDYIANPKENGYKSIHLAFIDASNNIFEVQIRTILMDTNAEYGPALEVINLDKNSLKHNLYKDQEYEDFSDFTFDIEKVNKPLFRTYRRLNKYTNKIELVIIDRIGLLMAKPIEERAHTF